MDRIAFPRQKGSRRDGHETVGSVGVRDGDPFPESPQGIQEILNILAFAIVVVVVVVAVVVVFLAVVVVVVPVPVRTGSGGGRVIEAHVPDHGGTLRGKQIVHGPLAKQRRQVRFDPPGQPDEGLPGEPDVRGRRRAENQRKDRIRDRILLPVVVVVVVVVVFPEEPEFR